MTEQTVKPDVNQSIEMLVIAVKCIELALRDMDCKDTAVRVNVDRISACLVPFKGNIIG